MTQISEVSEPLAIPSQEAHPNCFVCSGSNPFGLALHYELSEDGSVNTSFIGNCAMEGYPGLMHGGLIAAVLDGAMTQCLFAHGIRGLTAELRVRYREPVSASDEIIVRGWLADGGPRLHQLGAELRQEGRVKAFATAKFIVPR